MSRPMQRRLVPATGLGRAGSVVALLGVAVLAALIVAGARQTGPDERPGFWGAWLLIAISGVLLLAALRRGERALLAYAALVPFALFLLLLLMELTGLME
jgi:hypothetical protein